MKEFSDEKEFEERADFIKNEDLIKWTVEGHFFLGVQKKLLQKSAKLIVGPRGAGKTHQMKFAYNTCLHNRNRPLAIYVSFGKYYYLEPFLSKKSNAITIFHTWVLSKILLGCYQLLSDLKKSDSLYEKESVLSPKHLEHFVSQIEKNINQPWHDEYDDIMTKVTINEVIKTIESLASKLDRKRTILLLDDAALTLTPDYLIEFFDIFRSLKTINIAPKASVYPGTTIYGPRFHVGHDAEKVESWLNIEDENYSQFMGDLIEKRSLAVVKKDIPEDIIGLFKYASFGIPRTFMNLLKNYIDLSGKTRSQRFTKVINEQKELIKGEYLSLYKKLPQYQTIIEIGWELHEKIIEVLTIENKNSVKENEKQLQIGISKEHNVKLDRMLKFLIEAGLLYELKPLKKGINREYNKYIPHLLFLIENRAFSVNRGFNSRQIINFIESTQLPHPVMRTFETLLSSQRRQQIGLNLPPCKNCGTERLTEEQFFCHHCGKELVRQSTFELCMQIKIEDLPITKLQKKRIKEQTKLRTIGDFLIADPATELRKVKGIGEKHSEKIHKKVMERVEEFLA